METVMLVGKNEFVSKEKKVFNILECYNSLGFLFKSFVSKEFYNSVNIGDNLTDFTYRRYNSTKNKVDYYINFKMEV